MQNRYFTSFPRLLTMLACVGSLAGCVQPANLQPQTQWQSTAKTSAEQISPELKQFLQTAGDQSTAFFEQTPWGHQTEVTVQSRYYAGSGRECLRLQVTPAAVPTQVAIACDQNGQWVSVRPVTQLLNAR
jgi:hypothetical protein